MANTPAQTLNPPAFQQEGYIPQYIQYLEKQNKADATIRTKFKILRILIREKVNLFDPEEVKLFIKRNKNWSDGHKANAVYAYNDFCKMMKIEWEKQKSPDAEKQVCFKPNCRGFQKSPEDFQK